MRKIKTKLHKYLWKILFTILLIIIISLSVWFIVNLRDLYRAGELRPTRGLNRNHIYKQTASPDQIQGWMTFSYVNYIFNLPPDYLSGNLNIQDSHYLNLGINQYAKMKNFNTTIFLTNVRESIAQYTKSTQ